MTLSEDLRRKIIKRMEQGKIPIYSHIIRQKAKAITRYKAEKQAELRRRQAARKVKINAERRARAKREAAERKATPPSPPKHEPTPEPAAKGVSGGYGADFAVAESIPMGKSTPEQQFKKGFEGLFTRGVTGVSTVLTSLHPHTVARKAVESITGKVEMGVEKVKTITGVSAREQRKEVAKKIADVKTIEREYKKKGWIKHIRPSERRPEGIGKITGVVTEKGFTRPTPQLEMRFVGSPEHQAQLAKVSKLSAGISPHIKGDIYTHPAVIKHTKKWAPYIMDESFVSPAITQFKKKWSSFTRGEYFTGTETQHAQYLKDRDRAIGKEATQHARYLKESDIVFGKQKTKLAAYHGAIARLGALERTRTKRYEALTKEYGEYEVEQKEYERLHGLSVMGKYERKEAKWAEPFKPSVSFAKKSIGYTKTPEVKREIEKAYGRYRSLFGLPTKPFKIERKAARIESEYKIGIILEGIGEKPLKTAVTTAAFLALPPALKVGRWAAKPAVVAGTRIFPHAVPWVAKWAPRAVGGGLTGAYAVGTGTQLYKTPPELRAREFGKITGTELIPMGVGIYAGVKALPYMVKVPRYIQSFAKGKGFPFQSLDVLIADTSGMGRLRKKWALEQAGREAKFRSGEWKPIETRGGILIQKMIPALEGKAKLRVGHRKAKLQTRTTTKAKQKARDRARAGKRKYLGEVGEYDAGTRKAIEMERARMIKAQQEPAWYLRKAKRAEITQTHKQSMAEISKAIQKGRQDYWSTVKTGTQAGLMFVSKIGFIQVSRQKPLQEFKSVQQEAQESIATTVQKARHVPISMFGVASRYATEQASSTKQAQLYLSGLIAEIGVATKQVQIQKAKETTMYEKTRKPKAKKPIRIKPIRIRTTRPKQPLPLSPFAWEDDGKKKKKRKGKAKKQWEWLEEFTVQLPHELRFGVIESGIPKVSKVVMLPQVSMAGIVNAIKPKTKKTPKKRTTKKKRKKTK